MYKDVQMAIYFVAGSVRAIFEGKEEYFKWSGVINFEQPVVFEKDLENLRGIAAARVQEQASEDEQGYEVQEIILSALSQLDVAKWLETGENEKFFYWVAGNAEQDAEDETEVCIAFEACLTLDNPILSENDLKDAEARLIEQRGFSSVLIANIEFLLAAV